MFYVFSILIKKKIMLYRNCYDLFLYQILLGTPELVCLVYTLLSRSLEGEAVQDKIVSLQMFSITS